MLRETGEPWRYSVLGGRRLWAALGGRRLDGRPKFGIDKKEGEIL